ncbi:unnamed protein product [Psylliodes chrysocephalus]|uniref:Spaetzle domain-containing protein n=1 Tax=Psylliodes chrysocephalus TaxID=3402493 RepID=A0A9P0GJR8_9CUCU|nr:unnamed protein product [Psylliodes chrysocephala]
MRIAHCIRALIAVLGLAAVVIPVASCNDEYFNETDSFYDFYRHKRSAKKQNKQLLHIHEGGIVVNAIEDSYVRTAKKLHQHHNTHQHLETHRQHVEIHHLALNRTGECCPTVFEKVEPLGGSNQDGMYVELYQDHNYKQRFFELSCDPAVIDRPCNFINRRNHQSKCVQKYSFSYALVKNSDSNRTKHFPMFPVHEHGGATYTLDYIKVRSGCSCEVTLKKKRKKKNTKGHPDNT